MWVVILCSLLTVVDSVPVANGVTGLPEISCGPTSLGVSFTTEQNFEGHLYVKGRYTEDECHAKFGGERPQASIDLPFPTCGVQRLRSANPRGIFVTVTVIISFHPLFLTKIDRAVRLQCFYMEADKTVTAELEVSMITTDAFTQNVPMPICRYEVRREDQNGEIINYANVGEKVYHKWTCDTETRNTFCILVHSCFVADSGIRRIQLLNENGCANDKFVLGNLEYLTDLMAGREVHVYKFPDTTDIFFDCQIRISVKDPDVPCAQTRPPCVEPVRGKRSVEETCALGTCVDVATHYQTLDRFLQNSNLSYTEERAKLTGGDVFGIDWSRHVCLSWPHFASALGGMVVLCLMLSVSILVAIHRRAKRPVVLVFQTKARLPPPPPHKALPPLPTRKCLENGRLL